MKDYIHKDLLESRFVIMHRKKLLQLFKKFSGWPASLKGLKQRLKKCNEIYNFIQILAEIELADSLLAYKPNLSMILYEPTHDDLIKQTPFNISSYKKPPDFYISKNNAHYFIEVKTCLQTQLSNRSKNFTSELQKEFKKINIPRNVLIEYYYPNTVGGHLNFFKEVPLKESINKITNEIQSNFEKEKDIKEFFTWLDTKNFPRIVFKISLLNNEYGFLRLYSNSSEANLHGDKGRSVDGYKEEGEDDLIFNVRKSIRDKAINQLPALDENKFINIVYLDLSYADSLPDSDMEDLLLGKTGNCNLIGVFGQRYGRYTIREKPNEEYGIFYQEDISKKVSTVIFKNCKNQKLCVINPNLDPSWLKQPLLQLLDIKFIEGE